MWNIKDIFLITKNLIIKHVLAVFFSLSFIFQFIILIKAILCVRRFRIFFIPQIALHLKTFFHAIFEIWAKAK